jgi:WD40 repeat protein/tetratricopeptide (TPR) repeat protein
MGVVYWAWQTGLRRTVALKMVLAGAHAGAQERARFQTEAEAVARLQHPSIVQVYDVGQAGDHPYLVLEYVEGGNLAGKLAGTPLASQPSAQLVETLARAMHYAHEQGIVHRDLTPANVLLTKAGVPKITDFGVAKILVGGGAVQTQTGAIIGTPSYMAPEQAGGKTKEIVPAADVYALGAILYELLTGRPPFRAQTPLDTLMQTQSEEPVSPSRLQPKLPRDVVTICLKCLEKQPGKRYASALALAEDLQRFQVGEPIQARPVGPTERLWRWCRRNPALAGLAASVVLLLLVLTGGALLKNAQLAQALSDSQEANRKFQEANRKAEEKVWESLRDRAQALRLSRHSGQRIESLRSIREALQLPLPKGHALQELRMEAIAALALPDLEVLQEWDGNPAGNVALGLDFDSTLERYARLATDGTVSVRRVSDDAEIARWQEPVAGAWPLDESNLRCSPDGRFVCVRQRTSGRFTVRRITGSESAVCHTNGEATKASFGWAMDFSPDSKLLAYLLADTRIAVVELDSGRTSYLPPTGVEQEHIRFAPDGRRFALGTRRAGKWVIEVRDAATGEVQCSLPHPTKATHPAWHPDGRTLATCGNDQLIRLWDVASGELLRVLEGHKIRGLNCAFTHLGDRLVSNDWQSVLRVWELSSGRQLLTYPAAGYAILRVSPDDRVAAMHVADPTKLQRLRLYPGLEYRTLELANSKSNRGIDDHALPVVHPGGRLLAALATDGSVALVDLSAGREVATLPSSWAAPLRWEPSGDLLTFGRSGLMRWPVDTDPQGPGRIQFGPPKRLLSGGGWNIQWGTSSDGQTIAVPAYGGAVVVHRSQTARTIRLQPQEDVRCCAVSPDGRWVATGSHDNTDGIGAKVWEAATGRLVKGFTVPGYCKVLFSPDDRWLLTSSGGCRLWEVGSWNEGPKVGGASGCFSPDGRFLAVEDSAGVIRLIHPDSGAEVARLEAPQQTRLWPCCFTPDGSQLISFGTERQALHIWDLRAIGEQLAPLGLDGDLPPYDPRKERKPDTPLQIQVELFPATVRISLGLNSFLLAVNPFNFEAYLQRGRAYGQMGEARKAIVDYSMALDLLPPAHQSRGEALFRRSNNYGSLNDLSKARADLQKIAELDLDLPSDLQRPAALQCNNLAWRYVTGPEEQRDPNKALPLAQKAAKLTPNLAFWRNTLGVVYYRLGQYAQAIETLQHSLRATNGQTAAFDLFFLAMCHARQGDSAKAKDCYDRAVHWAQEQQGKLRAEEKAELNAFRAEADALLGKP